MTNQQIREQGNKTKPAQQVIDYFNALGFEYKVVTESIYTDKRDVPIHFFQSYGANGAMLVSTILADDAIKLYENVSEPFNKKVERTFGERCKNGHLRCLQPCKQCKTERKAELTSQSKDGQK